MFAVSILLFIYFNWRKLNIKCAQCGQAAADAKYYGNTEVYNILKARGAKVPV